MSKKSLKILSAEEIQDSAAQGGVSRRNFLKILGGASAATAVGCADSAQQNIFPFVKGEKEQNPGVAVWYSSTCSECSTGCGIRVRTREGRAVKIEGNPEHPINKGGLCAIGQASLQHLYDPDRIRQPLIRNSSGKLEAASWGDALSKVKDALKKAKGSRAIVTGQNSGAQKKLLESFAKSKKFKHVTYEPLAPLDLATATEELFGEYGVPSYSFDKADVIVSFGADFLETWLSPVEFAKGWAKARKRKHPVKFVHVEPRLSLTGANADLWVKPKPGSELYLALAILKSLLQRKKGSQLNPLAKQKLFQLVDGVSIAKAAKATGVTSEKILIVAEFLAESKSSLVVSGGASAAHGDAVSLAKVTHLLNLVLGNVGKTVHLAALQKPDTSLKEMAELVKELESDDALDLVFVYGSDPAFSLPSASRFNYALRRAGLVVSFSSHMDDTTALADVVLPSNTSLESWGDREDRSGLHSLLQPVMTPVFDTREFGDLLIDLGGKDSVADGAATFKEYLEARWKEIYAKAQKKPATFKKFWLESLERGGYFADYSVESSASPRLDEASLKNIKSAISFADKGSNDSDPVLLPYPSVKTFDGRSANRPWLQELPDPITKVVWGSWVEMHPNTAKRKGIQQGDVVQLTNFYGQVNAPAYITEHISEDVVAVPIGHGHEHYGRFAESDAGNVLQMLPDQLERASGGVQLLATRVSVKKGRGSSNLVVTQGGDTQGFREIAKTQMITSNDHGDHHDDHHDSHHGGHHEVEHFYDQRTHPMHNWGMAVDLAACTGCSACVVACYAENNIPTVGKEVADQGREMSWLRLERYFDGSAEELQVSFLPMMCQHCNNAPCEPVCPVYATYHNEEGLNAMVYNRCVGTRYCGNNCSYKVRRYNWFEFDWPEPLNWQLNPDVTKRTAGVMEKCTFCVQRINEGKDRAKDEGRPVRDGEIQPACVQSCPTDALVFGDLNDPKSRVSKLAHDQRAYKVLDHHLNTQPSVSYLSNIKHKV